MPVLGLALSDRRKQSRRPGIANALNLVGHPRGSDHEKEAYLRPSIELLRREFVSNAPRPVARVSVGDVKRVVGYDFVEQPGDLFQPISVVSLGCIPSVVLGLVSENNQIFMSRELRIFYGYRSFYEYIIYGCWWVAAHLRFYHQFWFMKEIDMDRSAWLGRKGAPH